MSDPTPREAALADLLAAIREGIDIPHAATMGDEQTRDQILRRRIMHVSVALEVSLAQGAGVNRVTWSTAYLRERLADHPPVGYVTSEQGEGGVR